jgi:hypothetical protein
MNKKVAGLLFACFFPLFTYGASNGFFSNDIKALSGSNDTLSILTAKIDNIANTQTFSLSHITSIDSTVIANDMSWMSINFEKNQPMQDLAFGDEVSVVLFDTTEGNRENQILLVNHKDNSSTKLAFTWGATLKNDTNKSVFASSVTFAKGSFYFSCNDGGLVRYNLKDKSNSVLTPGVAGSVPVNLFPGITDTIKRVTSVESINDFLIVTSPSATYLYSLSDSSWTEYNKTCLDPGVTIKEFEYSLADGTSPVHPLYSITKISRAGKDTTVLCKYSKKESGWRIMLDYEVNGLCFGPKGYLYTFTSKDSTDIKVYHDTLGDSGVSYQPRSIESYYYIPGRLARGSDVPNINDIQFIQKTDTSGVLWVATSSGLFLSRNEIPGKSTDPLICIKRVAPVKGALKQAFASPGILKFESQVRFVYNLSKSGKVTIRVYDYNMDLVKTIVDKEPRPAGDRSTESGRSNDKLRDTWDGTNTSGRSCAPGVYYFKITTDIGEHAFGKIVVAK